MRTPEHWKQDFKDWQWPPAFMFEWFYAWCEEADPLLMLNPLWYFLQYLFSLFLIEIRYRIMAVLSPFAYLPFYAVASYAFIKGITRLGS